MHTLNQEADKKLRAWLKEQKFGLQSSQELTADLLNTTTTKRPDDTRCTPLALAIQLSNTEIVKQLLEHKVDPLAKYTQRSADTSEETKESFPLRDALSSEEDMQTILQILDKNLSKPSTALDAIIAENEDPYKNLIACIFETDITTDEKIERLKFLIEHTSNKEELLKYSILSTSCLSYKMPELDCKKIIDTLLEQDVDINACHPEYGTAVMEYAKIGKQDIIEYIFTRGFNKIDAVDAERNTALHYAAMNAYTEIVKFLLEKGAKTDIENNQNKTAAAFAAERKEDCEKQFKRYNDFAKQDENFAEQNKQRAETYKALIEKLQEQSKKAEELVKEFKKCAKDTEGKTKVTKQLQEHAKELEKHTEELEKHTEELEEHVEELEKHVEKVRNTFIEVKQSNEKLEKHTKQEKVDVTVIGGHEELEKHSETHIEKLKEHTEKLKKHTEQNKQLAKELREYAEKAEQSDEELKGLIKKIKEKVETCQEFIKDFEWLAEIFEEKAKRFEEQVQEYNKVEELLSTPRELQDCSCSSPQDCTPEHAR